MNTVKVMLVDDEVDFTEILQKRMKKRNIDTLIANSGKAAISLIKKEKIDVVVLDMKMPDLDGIQTMKELKKINPLLEVIMLTGHASLGIAKEGIELGAFDYLMKPIDTDSLIFKIQDAYKRKILQEEKIDSIKEIIKSRS
ncbi:MAG: response regulator [Desulfobacterales bacterium]|nr:response regulator [Desulfobacterales bacterium]MBF0397938.1 response regulator [Desulfobacterales bacterium]